MRKCTHKNSGGVTSVSSLMLLMERGWRGEGNGRILGDVAERLRDPAVLLGRAADAVKRGKRSGDS